jgi:hypothetical protein
MKSSIFWDKTLCSQMIFNGVHGVIFQKTELFITIRNKDTPNFKFLEADIFNCDSKESQ